MIKNRHIVLALAALAILLVAGEANARATTEQLNSELLQCVCSRSEGCMERRAEEIEVAVNVIAEECRAAKAPESCAWILAATACGESGAKAHPSGHNDGGTSAGWYQFKVSGHHVRWWNRHHNGMYLDLHDLRSATRLYIARMQDVRAKVRLACGKEDNSWLVSAGWVAKGAWALPPEPEVTMVVERPVPGIAASMPEVVTIPARPGIYQCSPRRYGEWASDWMRE